MDHDFKNYFNLGLKTSWVCLCGRNHVLLEKISRFIFIGFGLKLAFDRQ